MKACIGKFCLPLLLLLSFADPVFPAADAPAADRENPVIENLDIQAVITERGLLSVEETLTVRFSGEALSQDLTRGISGHYSKSGKEKSRTGFVLLNAMMDDRPAETNIRRNPESLRLILASKGDAFPPGRHTFRLKYELINMIVFHPEQDSLIWRVIRGSSCPVENASVHVALPGSAPFRLFSGQMAELQEGSGLSADVSGTFAITKTLPADESLTLYMAWDKGLVREQRSGEWQKRDIGVLIVLVCYYTFLWLRCGRLPRQGAPVPTTTPPEGLSPGLLRSQRFMKTDARALTAEILNLAVRGFVHIDDFTAEEPVREPSRRGSKRRYSPLERMMKRRYRLSLLEPIPGLSPTPVESILMHNLFQGADDVEIVLDESSAPRIQRALRALARHFAESGRRFLFRHMNLWALGLFFFEAYTAFAMFQILSQGVGGIEPDSEHALAFMAPLFLLAPFLGGRTVWKQSTPVFILRTCIPLFFCACALAVLRQQGSDLHSIAALVGCIAVIGLFWKTAPVRSAEGVRLLDETESFRLGLGSRAELKEGDTLEKFERLFPYACALDRERALIARYDPLITRLRHHARWHTADTHSFSGGAEYFSLAYELEKAVESILRI